MDNPTIKTNEEKFDPSGYSYFKAIFVIDGESYEKAASGITDAVETLEDAKSEGASYVKLIGVKYGEEIEIPLETVGVEESTGNGWRRMTALTYLDDLEKLEGKESREEVEDKILSGYCGYVKREDGEWIDPEDGETVDTVDVLYNIEYDYAVQNFGQLQESKGAEEKLGYEKGHKNSRGEDAPWVIRSHEDNRVLASFAKKEDAEEHLKRMMQYSKEEGKTTEDLESYACYIDFETEDDAKKGLELVKDWNPLRDGTAVLVDGLGEGAAKSLWNDWKDDCAKIGLIISDEGEVYKEEPSCIYNDESNKPETTIEDECTRANEECKENEASDLKGYTSDVISELDVVWACGLDGANRLAKKYADVIQQNYTDGDLLASETAKFIAEQENLVESCKKQESKKSEIHMKLIETIVVPKWLWEAHLLGNEYGEDLDENEQEILAKFEEEYGKQYHLDDRGEEADFRSRNDFDEYGGPCYEVDVYET